MNIQYKGSVLKKPAIGKICEEVSCMFYNYYYVLRNIKKENPSLHTLYMMTNVFEHQKLQKQTKLQKQQK